MYPIKRSMAPQLVIAVVFILYIQTSSGACCKSHSYECSFWECKYRCDDCSKPTPCCGYGKCNIFCCNCDCRTGSCRRRRDVSFTTDTSAYFKFNSVDANKNGMMEKCEFNKALENMKITDNVTVIHHWTIMDKNNDGVITMEEFDNHKE